MLPNPSPSADGERLRVANGSSHTDASPSGGASSLFPVFGVNEAGG